MGPASGRAGSVAGVSGPPVQRRMIGVVAKAGARVTLSREELNAATDGDLLNLVRDRLMDLRRPHYGDDGHVRTLPRGLQMLWAIEMVDADIVKDGIAQIFETSDVQWLPDAVEAFQRMGSPGHAAVLERAVETVFGKPLGQPRLQPVDDMTDEAACVG